ncbi:MAG: LysR family transcriptional regulator [Alphaproteobacteria bacterium]
MPYLKTLNRLTVKQLRALVEFDEAESLTSAADRLGISQPALSNRFREIERLTGAKIFHRTKGHLHFAPSGYALLNAARVILDELHQVEINLEQARNNRTIDLRIEVRGYNLHRPLSQLLVKMMRARPELLIEVTSDSSRLPLDAVLSSDVDLTITLGDFSRRGLQQHFLAQDELIGVVPVTHPLADKEILEPRDFEHEPFITYSPVLERGQEIEQYFIPAGIIPRNLISVGTADYACGVVANGFGVSILSRWASEQYPDRRKIRLTPLARPGLTCRWHAITRRTQHEHPVLTDLLARLPDMFHKTGTF